MASVLLFKSTVKEILLSKQRCTVILLSDPRIRKHMPLITLWVLNDKIK